MSDRVDHTNFSVFDFHQLTLSVVDDVVETLIVDEDCFCLTDFVCVHQIEERRMIVDVESFHSIIPPKIIICLFCIFEY